MRLATDIPPLQGWGWLYGALLQTFRSYGAMFSSVGAERL